MLIILIIGSIIIASVVIVLIPTIGMSTVLIAVIAPVRTVVISIVIVSFEIGTIWILVTKIPIMASVAWFTAWIASPWGVLVRTIAIVETDTIVTIIIIIAIAPTVVPLITSSLLFVTRIIIAFLTSL